MSRLIPFVVYTEAGRVVIGEVDVDNHTARLNQEGASILDERLVPPVDDAGNVLEGPLPVELQFVLGPHFMPPEGETA